MNPYLQNSFFFNCYWRHRLVGLCFLLRSSLSLVIVPSSFHSLLFPFSFLPLVCVLFQFPFVLFVVFATFIQFLCSIFYWWNILCGYRLVASNYGESGAESSAFSKEDSAPHPVQVCTAVCGNHFYFDASSEEVKALLVRVLSGLTHVRHLYDVLKSVFMSLAWRDWSSLTSPWILVWRRFHCVLCVLIIRLGCCLG